MVLTLRQGDLAVVVDPARGSRLTDLRVAGLALLGRSGAHPSASPSFFDGCFPMAPYAGRVGHGRLQWQDDVVDLPVTFPPHAIHGTVHDVAWEVVEADQRRAVLRTDLGAAWPWGGTAESRVELADGALLLDLSVVAADRPMPAWVGWHPWFRRRLFAGDPPGYATLVDLDEAEQLVRATEGDLAGLPTGQRQAPTAGPWDDAFAAAGPARVVWPGRLELTIHSSGDWWVIYDERPDAFCVEPQTGPPDATRLGLAASLGPFARLDLSTRWTFAAGGATLTG